MEIITNIKKNNNLHKKWQPKWYLVEVRIGMKKERWLFLQKNKIFLVQPNGSIIILNTMVREPFCSKL